MATTPEAKVKAVVKKFLVDNNVYYFMPATHGFGRSGVPDFVACYKGRFVGIECKAGKGKLTALQQREADRIGEAGGAFILATDTDINTLENELCELFALL